MGELSSEYIWCTVVLACWDTCMFILDRISLNWIRVIAWLGLVSSKLSNVTYGYYLPQWKGYKIKTSRHKKQDSVIVTTYLN